MTVEEREEVKHYVLREVRQALVDDQELALILEGMLAERFPKRDEFARLLDEVQASRKENQQRFDAIDGRIDGLDGRIDGLDGRIDGLDGRIGVLDGHIDGLDGRIDGLENELHGFRADTNQRFEQMDQRFEKVDQRFEQMDQRFEKVDQRFDALEQQIRGQEAWMHMNVGGLQNRAGRRLEDVVAGAFCYGLKRSDICPEQVRLRQKLTDAEGVVYKPGKTREVDLIAYGQGMIVFEVKSMADEDDVEDLADKVKLVTHQHPGQSVEGVLVLLGAEPRHREWCRDRDLRLIP